MRFDFTIFIHFLARLFCTRQSFSVSWGAGWCQERSFAVAWCRFICLCLKALQMPLWLQNTLFRGRGWTLQDLSRLSRWSPGWTSRLHFCDMSLPRWIAWFRELRITSWISCLMDHHMDHWWTASHPFARWTKCPWALCASTRCSHLSSKGWLRSRSCRLWRSLMYHGSEAGDWSLM